MRESMPTQDAPAQLPPEARQAGEVRARWAWAEASVWTERMLTAPAEGVKEGGRTGAFFVAHGLFSLMTAYAAVRQSAQR